MRQTYPSIPRQSYVQGAMRMNDGVVGEGGFDNVSLNYTQIRRTKQRTSLAFLLSSGFTASMKPTKWSLRTATHLYVVPGFDLLSGWLLMSMRSRLHLCPKNFDRIGCIVPWGRYKETRQTGGQQWGARIRKVGELETTAHKI